MKTTPKPLLLSLSQHSQGSGIASQSQRRLMKKYFKPSDDINNASNFVSNEKKLVGDHKDKDKRSNDINDLFDDLDDECFSNLPDPLSVKMIDSAPSQANVFEKFGYDGNIGNKRGNQQFIKNNPSVKHGYGNMYPAAVLSSKAPLRNYDQRQPKTNHRGSISPTDYNNLQNLNSKHGNHIMNSNVDEDEDSELDDIFAEVERREKKKLLSSNNKTNRVKVIKNNNYVTQNQFRNSNPSANNFNYQQQGQYNHKLQPISPRHHQTNDMRIMHIANNNMNQQNIYENHNAASYNTEISQQLPSGQQFIQTQRHVQNNVSHNNYSQKAPYRQSESDSQQQNFDDNYDYRTDQVQQHQYNDDYHNNDGEPSRYFSNNNNRNSNNANVNTSGRQQNYYLHNAYKSNHYVQQQQQPYPMMMEMSTSAQISKSQPKQQHVSGGYTHGRNVKQISFEDTFS